jgi:2,5-furandicarboxylate decarboxylase 1
MPFHDLREFVKFLESEGELVRVRAEVDPKHEIGAICRVLNQKRGPAVLFEKVRGSTIPVVAQLLASQKRVAMSLETDVENVFGECVKRLKTRIPPRLVGSGQCHEVVETGDDVDIGRLPLCTNNPDDGGPYVTAGNVIIKDPEFGKNLAMYRMMYHSKNDIFMRLSPAHHGYEFYKNAEGRGDKKMDFAIAIGVDPSIYMASQFVPSIGTYEMDIAGSLRGAPVDVVKCKTVDLEVPASSEIVIEGQMQIPPPTGEEGPFGEFCGYTTGAIKGERLMKITAITHRNDPLYHNIWLGRPVHEHLYINAISYALSAYNDLREKYPAVMACYAPPGCVAQTLVIQVRERLKRPGLINNLMAAALNTRGGLWKHVIAVDEDVNIYDPEDIEWAMTTRFQADRDLYVIPRCYTSRLDPSTTAEGITAKMFIDATRKPSIRGSVAEPRPEMLQHVRSRWKEYGLP